MSKVYLEKESIQKIANAIREKSGKTDLMKPNQMADEILAIPSGQPKIIDGMKLQGTTAVPNNLDTSEVTDMSYMFNASAELTTIPLIDTKNVTTMRSMFQNCSKLTEIPLLNTEKVENMLNMLYGCSSLTTIPLFNTENVTNMNYMFYNCPKLKAIPLLNTEYSTSMVSMFYGCSSLTTIPLLNTRSISPSGFRTVFSGCTSLSRESINNILGMCVNAVNVTMTSYKKLSAVGVPQALCVNLEELSNYQAFIDAGWTIGY